MGAILRAIQLGVFFAASLFSQVGISVLHVAESSDASRVGIRSGDIIFGWSQGSSRGVIVTPFDFVAVEREWAARGIVTLTGQRDGSSSSWSLDSPSWGIMATGNWPLSDAVHRRLADLARSGAWNELESYCEKACRDSNLPPAAQAWELFEAGTWLAKAARIGEASQFYAAAIKEGSTVSQYLEAQVYEAWGDNYADIKDWKRALNLYSKALNSAPHAEQSLNGAFYLDGLALFASRLGNTTQAIGYAQQALTSRKRFCLDCAATINTLNVVGVLAEEISDSDLAQRALSEALALSLRIGQTSHLATLYNNLGALSERKGDLSSAERSFLLALKNTSTGSTDQLWDNLGSIALARANPNRAAEYFEKSLAIQRKEGNEPDAAMTLNNLAVACDEANRLGEAETYARESLRLRAESSDKARTARVLDTLGVILRKRRQFPEAQAVLIRATVLEKEQHTAGLDFAETLQHLGEVYRDLSQMDNAEEAFSKAAAIRRLFVPTSAAYAESMASLGSIDVYRREWEKAAEHYEEAVYVLERQTENLGSFQDTMRLHGKYFGIYRELVAVMMQLGRPDRAFEILDRSRALGLLQMLEEGSINLRSQSSSVLTSRDQSLRKQIAVLESQRINVLTSGEGSEKISELDGRISELEASDERTLEEMRSESPHFAALTRPKQLRLPEMQSLLDPQTIALEYSLAPGKSYLFIVARDKFRALELKDGAAIENLARDLYSTVSVRRDSSVTVDRLLSDAGRILIGPASNLIERYRKIVVVSDGALQYIPFAALRLADRPLIEQHELVLASALSTLASGRTARRAFATQATIFADPVFSADDPRIRPFVTNPVATSRGSLDETEGGLTGANRGLPSNLTFRRLLNSRLEAEAIARALPGSVVKHLDFDASRETAMSPKLSHSRIIHFATHGFIDSANPQLSGLVFSLVDHDGKPQIGFLGLDEIFALKLPVDIVVLSACQTALGEEIAGQAVLGLAAGFKYAGANEVVATLWSIDDEATSVFMSEFYRGLRDRSTSVPEALRQAQLAMIHSGKWSAPFFWAAFGVENN